MVKGSGARRRPHIEARRKADNLLWQQGPVVHRGHVRGSVQASRGRGPGPLVPTRHRARLRAGTQRRNGRHGHRVDQGNFQLKNILFKKARI